MLRLATGTMLTLAISVGCLSGVAVAADGTKDKKVELLFNTYLPSQDPMRRVSIEDFSARIEKESGGSIDITIPGSSLSKPDGQLSAVEDRLFDLAMISVYASRNQTALPLLGDMPFNSLSGESASVAIWDTQQKYFDKIGEFGDVKLLSMHVLPGVNYVGSGKEINSIEDFNGTKIWATAGKQTDALKAVGAIPVHSYFPQLFEYVSKGTVDGAMIGAGTVLAASLGDHVENMTRFPGGMGSATWAVVMSKDAWNELSDNQKAAVLRAADGLPRRTGVALDERKEKALNTLDLKINDASPEFMSKLKDVLEPMKKTWIADAKERGLTNAEEAYDFYRNRMQEVYSGQAEKGGTANESTAEETNNG